MQIQKTFHVHGLVDAGCARSVDNALRAIPGIGTANANYLNSTVTLEYGDARITEAQLARATADCGHLCAGSALPNPMQHDAMRHAPTETAAMEHSAHMRQARQARWRTTPRTVGVRE